MSFYGRVFTGGVGWRSVEWWGGIIKKEKKEIRGGWGRKARIGSRSSWKIKRDWFFHEFLLGSAEKG